MSGYTDSIEKNKFHQFPVVSPKSGFPGLNIFQLSGQYTAKKFRAAVTLHYGDIALASWSPSLNLVQEANLGVRLGKNFWLDAGLFKTHIGAEGLAPKDNITSSMSLVVYYEPFVQAGLKLSYAPNDKLALGLHILQGYNNFKDNNKKKSLGISFSYALGSKGSIGYNNYIGDDTPDSIQTKHFRFLNDLIFTYQLTSKLKMLLSADYTIQQNSGIISPTRSASAYGGLATLQYWLHPKLALYARGEYFSDADGFFTGAITDKQNKLTGLKLWGITGGLEYKPIPEGFIRLEFRQFQLDKNQEIFMWRGVDQSSRFEWMLHSGFSF